jgi:hypothetical protein
MATKLFTNRAGRVTDSASDGKSLTLVEQRAASQIYVNDANTRNFIMRACAAPQWAQDPDTGLYVPYSEKERGQAQNLRLVSVFGNFDAIRETGELVHASDGFGVELARELPGLEEDVGGKFEDIPLVMKPYAPADRTGKEESYTAHHIDYLGESVDMEHLIESNLGWGKGNYVIRNRSSEVKTYRWKTRLAIGPKATGPYFIRQSNFIDGSYVDYGNAYATWYFADNRAITLDFHDMAINGQVDLEASQFDSQSAVLYSKPFTLRSGETYTVDPTVTPNPTSDGEGNNVGSAWAVGGGGQNAFGNVAPNVFRAYMRFLTTGIASGDTINDVALFLRVTGHVANINYNTVIINPYALNAQGNPATDTYATAYSNCGSSSDTYISGDTTCRTTGDKNFDLGGAADTDMAACLAGGSFSLGFRLTTENGGLNSGVFVASVTHSTSAYRPICTIDFTASGGALSPALLTKRRKTFRPILVR